MKKNRLMLLITMFLVMVLIPFNVRAEEVSCSKVRNTIEEYNAVVAELELTDCTKTTDNDIVKTCNADNTKKSLLLSKLFKYNDQVKNCNSTQLKKIINENSGKCTNVYGSTLKDLTNKVMSLFYILAPFLLIIFGSLDFSKIVVMSDPKMIKTARANFFKRLAAFILLFLMPAFVNIVLSLNGTSYSLTGNVYSCQTDYIYHIKRWETTYVPPAVEESGSGNVEGGSASSILNAADKVHKSQQKYTYSVGGDLYWNNIKKSTNNPNKVTCCATFVGSTLYVAGIFSEEEMNSYNYNSAPSTSAFLADKGWKKITRYSDLKAGDIVFMTSGSTSGIGHTQIYAGNGTWYNAGSTSAIQRKSPYSSNASARFLHAYRKP